MEDLLKKYAHSLGLEYLGLDTLIKSHNDMRLERLKSREERREENARIREFITKQAREEVLNGEYIKLDVLKKMTLEEIVKFVQRYSED